MPRPEELEAVNLYLKLTQFQKDYLPQNQQLGAAIETLVEGVGALYTQLNVSKEKFDAVGENLYPMIADFILAAPIMTEANKKSINEFQQSPQSPSAKIQLIDTYTQVVRAEFDNQAKICIEAFQNSSTCPHTIKIQVSDTVEKMKELFNQALPKVDYLLKNGPSEDLQNKNAP